LKTRFGLPAQLIKGSGGVFDVTLDGQLLFSKKKIGRFPFPGEVEEQVQARLGEATSS
jgi:selT/selW/selH-like putative selenoprotein